MEDGDMAGKSRRMDRTRIVDSRCAVEVILFDFGGVLAEEGFAEGLAAIAEKNGVDVETFVALGHELVHETGFVTGRSNEAGYWQAVRRRAGIRGSDEVLREEILTRFRLRPWMLEIVREVKNHGTRVGILSDQTLWLDELNAAHDFFRHFDHVFNSYHMGKSKMDPSHFRDVEEALQVNPEAILFVDDNEGHIERARRQGWQAILYVSKSGFTKAIEKYCPFIKASIP